MVSAALAAASDALMQPLPTTTSPSFIRNAMSSMDSKHDSYEDSGDNDDDDDHDDDDEHGKE